MRRDIQREAKKIVSNLSMRNPKDRIRVITRQMQVWKEKGDLEREYEDEEYQISDLVVTMLEYQIVKKILNES